MVSNRTIAICDGIRGTGLGFGGFMCRWPILSLILLWFLKSERAGIEAVDARSSKLQLVAVI